MLAQVMWRRYDTLKRKKKEEINIYGYLSSGILKKKIRKSEEEIKAKTNIKCVRNHLVVCLQAF